MKFPEKLQKKIEERKQNNSLRVLSNNEQLIDFSSNDYLGFSKSETLFNDVHSFLENMGMQMNGATGSRLLSGNHALYTVTEKELSGIHNVESALLFNSGYNANLGLFSSIPQRGDVILYDELIHASIRDGILLSNAKSYKFSHNDVDHLEEKIDTFKKQAKDGAIVYVVTESVFSMDGDIPNLHQIIELCKNKNAYLIVDEAHALGVLGNGLGLVQTLKLEKDVFARILTFGKALGGHGAVVLGSFELGQFLTNFARSFIYTTGLSPHAVATIKKAYDYLQSKKGKEKLQKLKKNIEHFSKEAERLGLDFIKSNSAIHCCIISGNQRTKNIAEELFNEGFNVRPILSPTVPVGKERLRFCLHSHNTLKQITQVLEKLTTFVAS